MAVDKLMKGIAYARFLFQFIIEYLAQQVWQYVVIRKGVFINNNWFWQVEKVATAKEILYITGGPKWNAENHGSADSEIYTERYLY